ncbi:MAG: PilZ domain-containing protein, partial [Pseudobdellovibrio sp.]
FYFRFPYLDRRANWFTKEERLDVRTDVKINGVRAITESISSTGCKVNFETPMEFSKSEKVKLKFSEISGAEVEAVVVEVAPLGLRVEFESSEGRFKQDLGRWIKSRIK